MVIKELLRLLKALISDLRRDLSKTNTFYTPYKANTIERKTRR